MRRGEAWDPRVRFSSVFWKPGVEKGDFITALSERLPGDLRLQFSGYISWASQINNLVSKHKLRLLKENAKLISSHRGGGLGLKSVSDHVLFDSCSTCHCCLWLCWSWWIDFCYRNVCQGLKWSRWQKVSATWPKAALLRQLHGGSTPQNIDVIMLNVWEDVKNDWGHSFPPLHRIPPVSLHRDFWWQQMNNVLIHYIRMSTANSTLTRVFLICSLTAKIMSSLRRSGAVNILASSQLQILETTGETCFTLVSTHNE